MSKIKLKENIWIEGFNDPLHRDNRILELLPKVGEDNQKDPILYWKNTSDITEELSKKCAEIFLSKEKRDFPVYKCYDEHCDIEWFINAKHAIESACPEKYAIIYKEFPEMTVDEINEGNQILSKFMDKTHNNCNELFYDSKWDWLMPIFRRITNEELYDLNDEDEEGIILFNIICDSIIDGDTIGEVFQNIVVFFKWFNSKFNETT